MLRFFYLHLIGCSLKNGKFIFCLGETVTPVVSMLSQVKKMFALSANIAMVVFTCVFNSVI